MSGLESSKPIEYYRRIRVKICDLCKVIWLVDLKLICTGSLFQSINTHPWSEIGGNFDIFLATADRSWYQNH